MVRAMVWVSIRVRVRVWVRVSLSNARCPGQDFDLESETILHLVPEDNSAEVHMHQSPVVRV